MASRPAAQDHQHQHHRMFRHRDGVAPLVVAHKDSPLSGGIHINGVESHPLGVNHFQPGEGVHDLPAHRGDGVGVRVGLRRLERGLVGAAEYQFHGQVTHKSRGVEVVAGPGPVDQNFHKASLLVGCGLCAPEITAWPPAQPSRFSPAF